MIFLDICRSQIRNMQNYQKENHILKTTLSEIAVFQEYQIRRSHFQYKHKKARTLAHLEEQS